MITDAYDLSQLAVGGTIRESVMDQIFDISDIPLPFTSRIGKTSHDAPKFEWVVDRLRAVDTTNAIIDGADSGAATVAAGPPEARAGNHSQISQKIVHVSHRANAVNTIGYARALAYELSMRGNELRRDVEAMSLMNNANVEDTGATGVAGESSGLEAWLDDENELNGTIFLTTDGLPSSYRDQSDGISNIGGWTNQNNGIIDVIDYTLMATPAALSEIAIKDVVEQLYISGADPTVFMARPAVCRRLSEFMFTSAARVATLTNQGGETSHAQRVAQMSVNVMVTDFSVLEIVPNRLMQASGGGTASDTAFIFDPNFLSLSYLQGYQVDPIGKVGLSDKSTVSVDWGLRVHNWTALGGIVGILNTAAVTAT